MPSHQSRHEISIKSAPGSLRHENRNYGVCRAPCAEVRVQGRRIHAPCSPGVDAAREHARRKHSDGWVRRERSTVACAGERVPRERRSRSKSCRAGMGGYARAGRDSTFRSLTTVSKTPRTPTSPQVVRAYDAVKSSDACRRTRRSRDTVGEALVTSRRRGALSRGDPHVDRRPRLGRVALCYVGRRTSATCSRTSSLVTNARLRRRDARPRSRSVAPLGHHGLDRLLKGL